jgi:hypothetical protein
MDVLDKIMSTRPEPRSQSGWQQVDYQVKRFLHNYHSELDFVFTAAQAFGMLWLAYRVGRRR